MAEPATGQRLFNMSLFSFFQSTPEKQIERLRKKVKEPHGDAAVREGAADKLFRMGDPAALRALLDRFTINVSPSTQDEREKEMVKSWLVQLGKPAVEPVIDFLKNERSVYWPARILRDILNEQDYCSELNSILVYMWENPPATAFPKTQLIRSAAGLYSEELSKTVKGFLKDEDDDVRLAAIEFLMNCPEEDSREELLKCYMEAEDRARIRLQILEDFADKGWTVRGFRPQVEESLPDNFSLTREGKITRIRK